MWGLGVGDINFKKQLNVVSKTLIKDIIMLNLQKNSPTLPGTRTATGSDEITKIIAPEIFIFFGKSILFFIKSTKYLYFYLISTQYL